MNFWGAKRETEAIDYQGNFIYSFLSFSPSLSPSLFHSFHSDWSYFLPLHFILLFYSPFFLRWKESSLFFVCSCYTAFHILSLWESESERDGKSLWTIIVFIVQFFISIVLGIHSVCYENVCITQIFVTICILTITVKKEHIHVNSFENSLEFPFMFWKKNTKEIERKKQTTSHPRIFNLKRMNLLFVCVFFFQEKYAHFLTIIWHCYLLAETLA